MIIMPKVSGPGIHQGICYQTPGISSGIYPVVLARDMEDGEPLFCCRVSVTEYEDLFEGNEDLLEPART